MRSKAVVLLVMISWLIKLPSPVLAQVVTGLSEWSIFIDPGHSQQENMGVNGYSEAEEVLRVALELRNLLQTKTDIGAVYLSRTNDQQQVSLSQRTDYANSVGAAWYHSIHSNAGPPEHNTTLLLWGQLYDGTPDPPVGGETMSAIMVDRLTRVMRISTSGSWGDCSFYSYTGACSPSWPGPYLWVNRHSNMPSELSEEGHHTNPSQNQLDMNAEYKRMLAYSFFWSILDYHHLPRPPVHILAGRIRDAETAIPVNGAQVIAGGQEYTTDTYESLFFHYTDNPDLLHNGFYFFEDLPETTSIMIVSAPHYDAETLSVSLIDTFITFRDVFLSPQAAPYLVQVNPSPGDTLFPAWERIELRFSRRMDTASVDSALSLSPASSMTFSWTDEGRRLTLVTDTLQYLTDYSLVIAASARDVRGHFLDGNGDGTPGDPFVLNFRTGPEDLIPPVLEEIFPGEGATTDLYPLITLVFDEPLEPASITLDRVRVERVYNLLQVEGELGVYRYHGQGVVTYFPTEPLLSQEAYRIRVFPGIADRFGNITTQGILSSFNTGDYDYTRTRIDNFEGDFTQDWWPPQSSGSTTGIISERTGRRPVGDRVDLSNGSQQALELYYTWDTTAGNWLIREYVGSGAARNVHFTAQNLLEVTLFSDGSGNLFRFCVDDNVPNYAAGNHEVSPWIVLDWYGWRRVIWDPSADGVGSWIGDGHLDGTLGFDSFQLSHVAGARDSGRIVLDNLRVLTRVPTAVSQSNPLPQDYALEPAYPNPFNSVTRITYTLPRPCRVSLKIFNIRGLLVKVLFEGYQSAGRHFVKFDTKGLSAGIYFCYMKADGFKATRKITLIK